MSAFLSLLFPFLFLGVPGYLIFRRLKLKSRMKSMSFKQYCIDYPNAFSGNRLVCHTCKSDRVQVKNVMRRTFMREHFCGQCGQTLYYTPEGSR